MISSKIDSMMDGDSKHKPFVQDKPSYRPARYAERVKQELSKLIPGELKDPRLAGVKLFTVTLVEITPDLKYAKIFFLLMKIDITPQEIKSIELALGKASSYLRRELMRRLKTKITPHLSFKYDTAYDNSFAMDKLFRKVKAIETMSDNEE